MKRTIPTVIAMAIGLIVLLDFFIDVAYLNIIGRTFVDWAVILGAFALLLGVLNLMVVHFKRIRERRPGWGYSIVLILALWVVLVLGLMDPAGPESKWVAWIFSNVQYPLQATLFALMAFFVVTAAYRAFRVRSLESIFFVVAGLLVLLGATPFGLFLWDGMGDVRYWILRVPALAGARGLVLGVALATVIAGLRLLLGIDRPYAD